ncbi:CoA transferase [Pararhodobacter sp. SW119]|uniref:CaiB/BaiF CoA transferase family protein n=1 Tax=Pararhodobacter sp. SW119 TaxID=2780075 RepID=UPI001ADF13D8|nr:CoA transferase [Pararhodobacter sp. SW119]
MTAPLSNIRVLDLSNVLAGPFCGHLLVHMGAEVIKVEPPAKGDLARELGADAALNTSKMGVSFLAQNAGKKSVTLNLKDSEDTATFLKLVKTADVLVENFRPGVMARLRLDYARLRHVNPRLIYCAISGFGQTGAWAHRPAYDQIIQGMSGVMSITGDAESAPLRVGYPVADTVGGLTAAFAVASMLNAPQRGGFIDVSMLHATLGTMGWAISNWLVAGVAPTPNGNENLTSAPSGTFRTRDAPINIAANKDEQWRILARHIGREDLIDNPNYRTREDRKRNRHALRAEIEAALAARPAEAWVDDFNALGVPAGKVFSVPEILEHPEIAESGLVARFDDVPGVERPVRVVRPGFRIDGEVPAVSAPPPALGQHTEEILTSLSVGGRQVGVGSIGDRTGATGPGRSDEG